ncbi:unnamed protein product [Penicillium viridicatum]
MTMRVKDLSEVLEARVKLAASRGFTIEYQKEQEKSENCVTQPELAPPTHDKYDRAAYNWVLSFKLSRKESGDLSAMKDEPAPSPQILKSFAEDFITTRTKLPSQKTACDHFINFTSYWERTAVRKLDKTVKDDVLNYIRVNLTKKYKLRTKPRERFLVTAKDIDYLLRRLFTSDSHDYIHERARVQTASSLALFAGSGSRAGAIVESSAYRHTNECLYYRHIQFHLKWGREPGTIKRWVTIEPKFLKGWRLQDDTTLPKNWFREHPVLGSNFIFWVIVHGIADNAFKNISSVEKLLAQHPPKGRESWTLEWAEDKKDLPFFRMVTPEGPSKDKALTFASLRHNNISLARRDGFKDPLRVHGIRGGVANKIDGRASEATRSQALDHQNPDTFLKYQSALKALDVQASFYDLEPDFECRDMEQSMAHHRDPNAPISLNAAAREAFSQSEEIALIDAEIVLLTEQISGKPKDHPELDAKRTKLYSTKANKLQARKSSFISAWWDASYDAYMAGNEFEEHDKTCVFEILEKYIPQRARLDKSLFTETTLDSVIGRQCLLDMIHLCQDTERVAYYPGLCPEGGLCPICKTSMSSGRAKHILQCRRKSLGSAPYQQRYKNGKRAHRRVQQNFAQFCYLCAQFYYDQQSWTEHCKSHLDHLKPRCGLMTFRSTLVAPAFCPFCLGDEGKEPDERFQQWVNKATLWNHIDAHLHKFKSDSAIPCPHPLCNQQIYAGEKSLRRHLYDGHSIDEPRPNCLARKRKAGDQSDTSDNLHLQFKIMKMGTHAE